jgi:MerR family transcriptional regulator, redox-sensitive transcriptional activator SoxR
LRELVGPRLGRQLVEVHLKSKGSTSNVVAVHIEMLTIGEMSERTGVAPSALRFYEAEGLIHATRSDGGQRRYARDMIRRVSFIRVAKEVGLSLEEIGSALGSLPERRTPTKRDWERLSTEWRPRIDHQIGVLERLRDRLTGCIGCGCLSMQACRLLNPGDEVAARGPGPRYVMDDE